MIDGKITLLAIVQNEERDLPGLLENCQWVDDIVIVDGGSSDSTIEIAEKNGARVFERKFDNFSAQRQYGLDQVKTEWVLWLDADERMDSILIDKIKTLASGPSETSAYSITIRSRFWGRYLDHVWKPASLIRLFQKDRCSFSGNKVHELVVCPGVPGVITDGWVSHDTYHTVAEHLTKINQYTELSLENDITEWSQRGGIKPYMLVKYPLIHFIERYIIRGGWRDGLPGFVMCVQCAYISFIKMAKAYERVRVISP
jgi:glycosyltransferase involved in cell wall biosynthesis